MHALERSKVTSTAKIESDNAIADKPGIVNNPNEYAGSPGVREARLLTGCNTIKWDVTPEASNGGCF